MDSQGFYAGGVAVSFSEAAVIFEDGYANKPGEFVPRRSTRTTLSCVAHGGSKGGTATFSISGDDKLVRVSGRSLPVTVSVPPEQTVAFEVVYEGQEPSGRENDIVAMATFTEEDDAPSTDDAFLTAVKVELVSRVYVKPFTVSFSGVQIYEVPCTNAIPPTGYFAMTNIYKGPKTHVYPNAGYLHIPDEENYVMTDRAGRADPYTNWFAGTLTWKVPIGWRRILRGHENQLATDDLDHALYDDDNSRPLLIGGREDAYTQTFKIESDGTSSIRKFGYKLERNRWLPFGFVSQTGEN